MKKPLSKTLFMAALAAAALFLGACGSKPTTSTTDYIGIDAAKEAALTAAGASSGEVPYLSAGLDSRNDLYFYEVAFTQDGVDHSYEIDALTGAVIGEKHSPQAQMPTENLVSNETTPAPAQTIPAQENTTAMTEVVGQNIENLTTTQTGAAQPNAPQAPKATQPAPTATAPASTQPASGEIDNAAALSAALKHAGVSESDIAASKVEIDYENGKKIFEVEFVTRNGVEYDYDISAADGSILSFDYDAESLFPNTPAQGGTTITEDQAKQAVLALVPGASAENIRIHLEEDDGRWEYEGSLICDSTEYEFKIDAYSGSVIEWEAEPWHR